MKKIVMFLVFIFTISPAIADTCVNEENFNFDITLDIGKLGGIWPPVCGECHSSNGNSTSLVGVDVVSCCIDQLFSECNGATNIAECRQMLSSGGNLTNMVGFENCEPPEIENSDDDRYSSMIELVKEEMEKIESICDPQINTKN